MKRAAFISTALTAALAGPAAAFPCAFDRECFEAEPCQASGFTLEVDIAAEAMVSDFATLTIVAVKQTGPLTTLFATGGGAEYLLSTSPRAARLSVHNNQGPEVITYLGACEGVS